MPGVFKALPLLFKMCGTVHCDWFSGCIAFCRDGRLAFVAVWKDREKK